MISNSQPHLSPEQKEEKARRLTQAAVCFILAKRFRGAAERALIALREAPYNVDALHAASQALLELGQYGRAENFLRKALGFEPGSLPIKATLSRCLYRNGHYEDVVSLFREIVPTDNLEIIKYYGLSLSMLDREVEAEPYLFHALEKAPDDYALIYHYAWAYSEKDTPDDLNTTLFLAKTGLALACATEDKDAIVQFERLIKIASGQNPDEDAPAYDF